MHALHASYAVVLSTICATAVAVAWVFIGALVEPLERPAPWWHGMAFNPLVSVTLMLVAWFLAWESFR